MRTEQLYYLDLKKKYIIETELLFCNVMEIIAQIYVAICKF